MASLRRIAPFLILPLLASAPSGAQEARADASRAFPAIAEKLEQKSNIQRYRAFKKIFDNKEQPRYAPADLIERLRGYEKKLLSSMARSDHELNRIIARWSRAKGLASGYTGTWQGVSWPFFSFSQALGAFAVTTLARTDASDAWPEPFEPDPAVRGKLLAFLRANVTESGMPLSYYAPRSYWETYKPLMNRVDTVLERLLTTYGLSIYDAALWQIALTIEGGEKDRAAAQAQTARLISGSSGELKDIRAYGPDFRYGEDARELGRDEAFFFRIIADRYMQADPLTGDQPVIGFPNFETPHHEDWKPIAGEQAWGAILGPLQASYLKNGGRIPADAPELKLALSILPAIEAMQSRIGAIYHVPAGTRGKFPNEISSENNFSMYGALRELRSVVGPDDPATAERIGRVMEGIERYFREVAFDRVSGVFYQGGFLDAEGFHPAQIFAADCQTWAILSLGPEWIDREFGEGAAFRIWENTRYRAGYIDPDGDFRGIGFSDGHGIYSVEWTCGAIAAVRRLRDHYRTAHPRRAQFLAEDVWLMRQGIERFRVPAGKGSEAYLYSNKRYFIQFGWWANPIPSLAATTWVLLIDRGFDPFILGGGPLFGQAPDAEPAQS